MSRFAARSSSARVLRTQAGSSIAQGTLIRRVISGKGESVRKIASIYLRSYRPGQLGDNGGVLNGEHGTATAGVRRKDARVVRFRWSEILRNKTDKSI